MDTATASNVVELTKRCTKCGEEKPLSAYRPSCTRSNGKFIATGTRCRACRRIYSEKWRAKNRAVVEPPAEKICIQCAQLKPIAAFRKSAENSTGWSNKCTYCHRANDKKRAPAKYKAGAERQKWYQIEKKFGLDRVRFIKLLEAQHYSCSICTKYLSVGSETCVDHDHKTGIVRGLLCRNCNFALGLLGDDPESFERAAKYLKDAKA